MQFKVGDLAEMLEGEVLRTTDNNSVVVKIGGKQHTLQLLKSGTDEFEFLLDNSFHHAKILQVGTAEVKMMIDGQPLVVKKHSKKCLRRHRQWEESEAATATLQARSLAG